MADQSLGRLTVDMVANTGSLETDVKKATDSVKGFTKQTEEQRESLERLVGQLDPTVAAYSKLDKMEEQLRKHRKAGQLSLQEYERFSGIIERQRKEVAKSTVAYDKNAKTAKELAFSMRGLPAQFTDIAVSLQSGQRPLTVLLQQGGQLKDMFGGIGPAARYMTSYIVGLINPITVLAAASVTLAAGFFKGRSETDAFNEVIAKTGNAAGTTAGQMQSLAASIDTVVGTQALASKALSTIAAEGKFVQSQFEQIAVAAINFQKATGQEIEETVKQFSKLADDPVEGIIELNKQYNFLTASVFQQIDALQEQGLEIEAAEMAYAQFAETLNERSREIVENTGFVEKGWKAVVNAVKEAGDAILSIGRERTLESLLEDRRWQLSLFERRPNPEVEKNLRAQIELLEEQIQLQQIQADAEETNNWIQQKGVEAQRALNSVLRANKTEAEKLQERYNEIENQVQAAALAGIEFTNQQIETLRRLAREDILSDDKKPSMAGENLLQRLREQNAVLSSQVSISETLSKAQEDLIEWNFRISEIKSKDILTAEEQSLLLNEEAITLQYEKNLELENELSSREEINKTVEEFNKAMKSLQTDEQAMVTLTSERLRLLREMQSLGKLSPGEFQSSLDAIVSGSVEASPDITSVGRANSNQSAGERRISEAQGRLDTWYSSQLEVLNKNRQEQADLNEKWNEVEAGLYEDYMIKSGELTLAMQEEKLKEANKQFDAFAESAAKNMQSAFADFLFRPFDSSVKGMVKSFSDAMLRMMAETGSAKLLQAGIGFLGASSNPVLSTIGSIFGGSRDTGGRGEAGKSYLIGSSAQPEMFVPDEAGTFYPNADKLFSNGGAKNVYEFNIDAKDAGAEERIRSMIERDVLPKIVQISSGATIAKLRRPGFS